MTLSTNGKNYISDNFGNSSRCFVATGLSWEYLGTDNVVVSETGGTATIVSRLVMTALVTSLTMRGGNSHTGTVYYYSDVKTVNDNTDISLTDASTIASQDGSPSGEFQYCYQAGTTSGGTTSGGTTSPPSGYGTIDCSTDPSIAEIWLDGTDTGHTTPYIIPNVATGLHNIVFKKVGWENCPKQVRVYANQPTIVSCPMIQDGTISCSTSPVGAEIWLDGTDTGYSTPWTLQNVSPGSHTVTFKLSGYSDCPYTVTVYSNQPAYATCDMQVPTTGGGKSNTGIYLVGVIALGALAIALSRRPPAKPPT